MLAYGISTDASDEYIRIGGSTILEDMKRWIAAIYNCFGETYLCQPTHSHLEKHM